MEIEQSKGKTVIHCGKQINIETVIDQQRLLFQALQSKKPIYFMGSTLTTVDTAGIQLLINFCKALTFTKTPWKWGSVSPTLFENAKLLGAIRWLQLPIEEKS